MSILKCKMCGGNLEVNYGQKVTSCPYCGVIQTISVFQEPNVQNIYSRASGYLKNNEFDKAENLFAQLLFDDNQNADAYWNILMCRYGVNYVKDPATHKYIPTCNRTVYAPIFSDENYKKAIEYATYEQKYIYEISAKVIDEIQKGIISVSKNEKPFDIFISYKEADANGNRTRDSIAANRLYEKLTGEGYKVFYSRVTLEDKAGMEYEPYIYSALYSSKVMLTVSSSKENIEATWVRNEWGRFLSLQQNNPDKALIPLYFGMDKSELPNEFAMIPSYNMSEPGFEEELIRGIKKQIPLPIMLLQKRKARRKVLRTVGISVAAVALVAGIIMTPTVINNSKYKKAQVLFSQKQYDEAKAIFETIPKYSDAEYMITRCEKQPEYDAALQLYNDGNYAQSAWAFGALGDYEDSAEKKKTSELSWRKSLATVTAGELGLDDTVYYIKDSGEVDMVQGGAGNHHLIDMEISKHGKIVSITDGIEGLYALHEDGYLTNGAKLNGVADDSEYQDIIKISTKLDSTCIALKSDGKMVFGDYNQPFEFESTGFDELSKWENIVDFDYIQGTCYEMRDFITPPIIGVKSDGTLCYTILKESSESTYVDPSVFVIQNQLKNNINRFSNVKKAYVSGCEDGILIVALTSDGKIQKLEGNNFTEESAGNICGFTSEGYFLNDAGEVLYNGNVVMKDVVYIFSKKYEAYEDTMLITRSGNVFLAWYDCSNIEKLDAKTPVYDEWTARLK